MACTDNAQANSSTINFTINNTNLYVFVKSLSARDNQKLLNLPSKGFERSVYWNEFKAKSENKTRQMNIDIFSNQILAVSKIIYFSIFKSGWKC